MNLKEAIDIYKDLVDTIIIQLEDGGGKDFEFNMPSEDAEFLDEAWLECGVAKVSMLPSADYCIIYLD